MLGAFIPYNCKDPNVYFDADGWCAAREPARCMSACSDAMRMFVCSERLHFRPTIKKT